MGNIQLSNGVIAKAMVSIDTYTVPEPSEYNSQTSTIVDGARNSQGQFIGAIVREDIARVDLTWKFISVQDWANLLQKFSGTSGGSFIQPVTFFNQSIGDWETRYMYISDRKANVFLRDALGNIKGYTNASLSLIEV